MKRSALRSDPAKTREWHERGRVKSFLKAATAPSDFRDDAGDLLPSAMRARELALFPGLKRQRRKRKATIPKGVRAEALARSEGRCIVCVYRLVSAGKRPGSANRAVQCHHVLAERQWPEFAREADNLVGVCPGCHDEHERAHRRIPRAALPACAVEFAVLRGLGWYIERFYAT